MNKGSEQMWECHLFGCGPNGVSVRRPDGSRPNAVWRLLQFICFGNRWVPYGPIQFHIGAQTFETSE